MSRTSRWKGWWQQDGYGRQQMHDLRLQFGDGTIQGGGYDIVGAFTFSGTYDRNGAVSMVKQYIGAHQVMYNGSYDGEGTIHGEWNIVGFLRGPFLIMLDGGSFAEEEASEAIVVEPNQVTISQ